MRQIIEGGSWRWDGCEQGGPIGFIKTEPFGYVWVDDIVVLVGLKGIDAVS